jgi:hypothetical protein
VATRPEIVRTRTNEFGGFAIVASAEGAGEVVGDLVFTPPGPAQPTTVRGVRMQAFATDGLRRLDNYLTGLSLQYFGEVLRDDGGAPVAEAEVEFVRTGGVAAAPRADRRAHERGRPVPAQPVPTTTGTLVGDLTIRATPAAAPLVVRDVRLDVFESDEIRQLGSWRVRLP